MMDFDGNMKARYCSFLWISRIPLQWGNTGYPIVIWCAKYYKQMTHFLPVLSTEGEWPQSSLQADAQRQGRRFSSDSSVARSGP